MAKNESTAINALIHDLQARPVDRASARNLFSAEDAVPEVPFVPKARAQATLQQPLPQIPSIAAARPAGAPPNKIRYTADSTPVRTARGTDAPPIAQQLTPEPQLAHSRSAQHAVQQAQHTPRPDPQLVQSRGVQRHAAQAHLAQPAPRQKFVPDAATVLERLGPVAETPDPDVMPRVQHAPDGDIRSMPAAPDPDAMPMMHSALPEHDDEETELWAAPPRPDLGSATPAQVAAAAHLDALRNAGEELSRQAAMAYVAAPMPLAAPDSRSRAAALPLAADSRSRAAALPLAAPADSRHAAPADSRHAAPADDSRRARAEAAARGPSTSRSGAHVVARPTTRSGVHALINDRSPHRGHPEAAARSGAQAAARSSAQAAARSGAHPAVGGRSAQLGVASLGPRDSQANAALARYLEASRRMSPSRQATSTELVSTTVRYAGMAAIALIAIGIGIYLAVFSTNTDALEPDRAVWIDVGASAPKPPTMTVVKAPPPLASAAANPVAEPAKSDSQTAKADSSEAAKTEPTASDAKSEPAKSEPSKSEPSKSEPSKSEPSKTASSKPEPAKAESAKTAPAADADDEIDESAIEMEPTVAKRPRRSSRRSASASTVVETKPAAKPERTKPERKLTRAEADDPVLAIVRSKPKAEKPTGPAIEITAAKGAAPAKGNGKVTIASNVAALIFVDGRPTGKSAPAVLTLPAGDHSITLLDPATKKAKTASVRVDPAQGATIRKDFN